MGIGAETGRSTRSEPVRRFGDQCASVREIRSERTPAASGPADDPGRLLLGTSDAMRAVREELRLLAAAPWPVRLEGPSGSGKGAAARFLHLASARRDGPFVTQPMTMLAAGLELGQLAGYTAGAFTGATRDHAGAFESAHGGTLFLDELADAGPGAQGILLHLLEDRSVTRLGEHRARRVDVRIVVATNRSLEEAVRGGGFREDLYHRLGSLVVRMPALRDHADDIPEIAGEILARRAVEVGVEPPRLTPRDRVRLQSFDWPGNVRELENALLYLLAVGVLPASLTVRREGWRARLDATLLRHGGNKAAAARHPGISRGALYKALAGRGADDPAVTP